MVFGLLEGLLDDWCLLNLTTIKWLCKAEVRQACINIWSLNKQAPWAAEFGKTVVSWEHAISSMEQIKLMHFEKMAIELELSMPTVALQPIVNLAPTPVSTTSSIQRAPSVPYIADPSSPPMRERSSQRSAPRNKGKGKAKAMEDDDNDKETAQKLRKELEDFVVLTTFDNKLLVSLLPPPSEYFEGDSGLPQGTKILGGQKGDITLVSPATRALVLEKNGTDPFMVRRFKLASTEESVVLIINQATEVPATQGTLHSEESGDEDAEGDDDDSDGSDVAMNVDSAKQPEETWPVAPIKTVTEVKAPALALAPALDFPYLLLGLQAPIQFKQNQPSMEQWQNQARGHYEVAHKMLEDARQHFELICQELQWVTMQHNAMALYLRDCDAVMNWHKMNNVELGEFSDTEDLPVAGGFPVIYPH
ncbi:hypothetical protein C0995_009420 [Termitomyces sp. Mi166|nr:hypothetical protein C0995_009420 [Termitomyces sp. Mi166\